MVMTYDHGTMRITKNDLRAHVDEFINKEQTALEHLLMNEHATLCLCCHDEKHAEKVRC